MRIIDADALKQNIEIWREQLVDTYGINDEYVKCLGSVIDYIDDAPTEEERKKGKGWLEQNKDKILQAGMEGREIDIRIGGRLFAIREKAQ